MKDDGPPQSAIDLVEKAERERKLIRSTYQGLLFTPKQLRKEWANGHFRWGAGNFLLIEVSDALRSIQSEIDQLQWQIGTLNEKRNAIIKMADDMDTAE